MIQSGIMQKDRNKMNKRLGLMRTIEHKRTISSEQGNYQGSRKYTLENCDAKKHSKQVGMPRKNQSLPRTLTTINQNNTNQLQKSIRSRKFVSSSSQLSYNDNKLSKPSPQSAFSLQNYEDGNGRNLSDTFIQAFSLIQKKQYKEASEFFKKILDIVGDRSQNTVYFYGVCLLHMGEADKAVLHLMKCLKSGYEMESQVLQILSQFFERTKNYISALSTLDVWAKKDQSAKCFLMRARIHYYFQDYEKAIADYISCYKIDCNRLQAYIEEAEATYKLSGIEQALKKYNNLLINYKTLWPACEYSDINYIKYRKGLLLMHEKRYKPALQIFKQITNAQLQSQTNYYLGTVYSILGNYEEATIFFCKSIEAKTSVKFICQSYYEKFVLMFKKNNFYGIQHQLDLLRIQEEEDERNLRMYQSQRSQRSEIQSSLSKISNSQPLKMMKKLIEGFIYILKMDFNEGVTELKELQQNKFYQKNQKHFKVTVVSFIAFAYYSLQEFDKGLEQLSSLHNKRMSQSNLYNLAMLKAIISSSNHKFNDSLKYLDDAEKIQPFNNHTWIVKAIVEIIFYSSLKKLNEKGNQNPKKVLKPLQVGKKQSKQRASKTIVPTEGKKFSKKYKSIDYEELQESNNSAEMNQQILYSAEELINRCILKQPENDQLLYILSVISYELGHHQAGLKAIRKAIEASDDHTVKHYYLKANLKVMLDMHAEAINDYSNAILVMGQNDGEEETLDKQSPILQCYLQRAKCYIIGGSKDKAESDLRIFYSTIQNVKNYKDELNLFMHVGASNVILEIYKTILEEQYDNWGKMKCYYLSKQLNSCLNAMSNILEEAKHSGSSGWSGPILTEKQAKLKKLSIDRKSLDALKKSSQGSILFIKESLAIFEEIVQQQEEGEIFKKSDILFFAGVLSFHYGDYSKAKNYFIDSKGQKLLKNELEQAQQVEDIDEIFDNKTYTLEEINYNIGVCDFIQGKWSGYLDQFSQFKKFHSGVTEEVQEPEQITPFPTKNRLCSIYSPQQTGNILYRLSFCLPEMKLPEIKFEKNDKIIQNISFKDIDMRPSAPWIEKNRKGIIFTGQIMKDSIDLKSEQSRNISGNRKGKKGSNRYKDDQI